MPPAEPSYRSLRVFAFDPSRRRRLGNHMTVRVRYEPLLEGLKGARVHVIDYDATNRKYYTGVNLNEPAAMLHAGLEPSESDPCFHQQMVYAVAMETIRLFESALGRDIVWQRGDQHYDAEGRKRRQKKKKRLLRIHPHAMQEANAYYSRKFGALLFGYFRASEEDAGSGMPGQTVFTCLSHDIIAHETTHAIVDSLRGAFMEPTNPDVFAFHEAFADIVALLQHFGFKDVLIDTIQRTGGRLHRFHLRPRAQHEGAEAIIGAEKREDNPLLDLARQFGESLGRRKALRHALSEAPRQDALAGLDEPHERGGVLVAAVFDGFFTAFMNRTADLLRIGRASSHGDNLHPDLAQRLAAEAAKVAQHFSRICIRALDYCPPVDITFGDFLRALITADMASYPIDAHDYREALIQAFQARGIYPQGVQSLAEDSLRWLGPEPGTASCEPLQYNLVDPEEFQQKNVDRLDRMARKTPSCFGLCDMPSHTATTCDCTWSSEEQVVRSCNAVVRSGEDRPKVEFVVELLRTVKVTDEEGYTMEFHGGSTVVVTPDGTPKFVIGKGLRNTDRQLAQKVSALAAAERAVGGSYGVLPPADAAFAAVHRGY
jgi:hypothetical protein